MHTHGHVLEHSESPIHTPKGETSNCFGCTILINNEPVRTNEKKENRLKSIWTGKNCVTSSMEETEHRANRLTAGITDSPRGATLSTSTSSFEALDPHDSNLSRLATKAFDKTSTYITHELNASIDDYKLLENMNRATIAKYSDMQQISENLATSSVQLKEKFDNLVSCRRLRSR